MARIPRLLILTLYSGLSLLLVACDSATPATTDVTVSKAEVDNTGSKGGSEFAPVEITSARDKLRQANQALADKDYKLADDMATQAQADAKLAQSKVNTAKAQASVDALQDDIQDLRDELRRANK